jgi:hypothetical protein
MGVLIGPQGLSYGYPQVPFPKQNKSFFYTRRCHSQNRTKVFFIPGSAIPKTEQRFFYTRKCHSQNRTKVFYTRKCHFQNRTKVFFIPGSAITKSEQRFFYTRKCHFQNRTGDLFQFSSLIGNCHTSTYGNPHRIGLEDLWAPP